MASPASSSNIIGGIVGKDVTKVCLGVLNEKKSLGSLNEMVITLIPKIKEPERMNDFRPISLCNVVYMIISKCINTRLRSTMVCAIFENQSGFMGGRQIFDNIIIEVEGAHTMKRGRLICLRPMTESSEIF